MDHYRFNSYHGLVLTHIDALHHVAFDGKMWNGFPLDQSPKNGIHNLKNGIFTRGILMDIPRLKGVSYLEPDTPIYPEDLEDWEKMAGVKVGAGDALLIPDGPVGASRRAGSLEHPRTGGRSPRVSDSLVEGARCRAAGRRRSDGCRTRERRGRAQHAGARFRAGRPWRACSRCRPSRSGQRGSCRTEPVGSSC